MSKDELGDRMKSYEANEAARVFLPGLPIVVRIDGRCFSRATRDLPRPFCADLADAMFHTTKRLVEETNAVIGYTQSDEISLVLYDDDPKAQPYFGGKVQKVVSSLASVATAHFNAMRGNPLLPQLADFRWPALFDCRAFVMPSKAEAANCILWRTGDAEKNSVSMLAREHFSHKELHGQGRADMLQMLESIGVVWGECCTHFKRGAFIRRVTRTGRFTVEEIEALPEKHRARQDPTLEFERHAVESVDVPPFGRVTNRVGFIFDGEAPEVAHD